MECYRGNQVICACSDCSAIRWQLLPSKGTGFACATSAVLREQLGPRAPSSLTDPGVHPECPHLLECTPPWDLTTVCVCGCWKLPFVCVTQNTEASTCKSRFLLDQMENICLIRLYSPSILLRECMLNTCCESKVGRQDH